jgi:hypothetical protein
LTLEMCGKNAWTTCERLGLPQEVKEQFNTFWQEAFFSGRYQHETVPMTEMVELAKAASEAGAEIFYLTGRPETLRQETHTELNRFGVPNADHAHLVLKESEKTKTEVYKVEYLRKWLETDLHMSFFITESRRDLGYIQDQLGYDVPSVLLDHPKEHGGRPVREDTPVWPSITPEGRMALGWELHDAA